MNNFKNVMFSKDHSYYGLVKECQICGYFVMASTKEDKFAKHLRKHNG